MISQTIMLAIVKSWSSLIIYSRCIIADHCFIYLMTSRFQLALALYRFISAR